MRSAISRQSNPSFPVIYRPNDIKHSWPFGLCIAGEYLFFTCSQCEGQLGAASPIDLQLKDVLSSTECEYLLCTVPYHSDTFSIDDDLIVSTAVPPTCPDSPQSNRGAHLEDYSMAEVSYHGGHQPLLEIALMSAPVRQAVAAPTAPPTGASSGPKNAPASRPSGTPAGADSTQV